MRRGGDAPPVSNSSHKPRLSTPGRRSHPAVSCHLQEDVCDRPGGKALIESMKQPQHIFPFNFLSVWPIRHSPGESVLNGPFATKAQVRFHTGCRGSAKRRPGLPRSTCAPTSYGRTIPSSPLPSPSQLGVIQYALVMPVLTLTKFIAQYNGVFREGQVRIVVVYPYVAAVRNVSQFTALYCLVVFFIVRLIYNTGASQPAPARLTRGSPSGLMSAPNVADAGGFSHTSPLHAALRRS